MQIDGPYGSRYISVDEVLKVKNLMDELKEKIQFVDFIDIPVFDTPESLLNSDLDCIKRIVDNHPEFNLETPISLSKGSIFLVCCEDGTNIDGIEYLIEKGAEINRTNFAGYNALMLIIRNENMKLADKLKLIKLLIDKGIDINWLNIYGETPLCVALSRYEKEIAELLIENGGVLVNLHDSNPLKD